MQNNIMCYVDICFVEDINESCSNVIKNQESHFSNQDTLTSLKKIQQEVLLPEKTLKTMWHGRDAKSGQHGLFI